MKLRRLFGALIFLLCVTVIAKGLAEAKPEEVASLPAPEVLPARITPGLKTHFLITVDLSDAPPFSKPIVQRLKKKDKWRGFGRLHDDGKKGDAVTGDGVYTLVKRYKPKDAGGLSLRVRVKQDKRTHLVSLGVLLNEAGAGVVPAGFKASPEVSFISNFSEANAQRAQGGLLPKGAGQISASTFPNAEQASLEVYSDEFIQSREVRLSSAPGTVAGRPALYVTTHLGVPGRDQMETRYVFVEVDTTSVTVISLLLSTGSANYTEMVDSFSDFLASYSF